MSRFTILTMLAILAGCGSHHHSTTAPPPPPPPPAAFADIAGTYLATVTFETGYPFDGAVVVGDAYTITVNVYGTVILTDQAHHAAVYRLTRLPDGSFQTDGHSVTGGLTEIATIPADLSTIHVRALKLWAGFSDQGTLYGTEDMILVKQAGG